MLDKCQIAFHFSVSTKYITGHNQAKSQQVKGTRRIVKVYLNCIFQAQENNLSAFMYK